MKLDNKKYLVVIFSIIFMIGCIPSAVVKEDIKPTARETREEVIDLQNEDPMDPSGLSSINSDS